MPHSGLCRACTWLDVLMPQAWASRFCFLEAIAAVQVVRALLARKLSLSSGLAQHTSVPLCTSMLQECVETTPQVQHSIKGKAGVTAETRSAAVWRPQGSNRTRLQTCSHWMTPGGTVHAYYMTCLCSDVERLALGRNPRAHGVSSGGPVEGPNERGRCPTIEKGREEGERVTPPERAVMMMQTASVNAGIAPQRCSLASARAWCWQPLMCKGCD